MHKTAHKQHGISSINISMKALTYRDCQRFNPIKINLTWILLNKSYLLIPAQARFQENRCWWQREKKLRNTLYSLLLSVCRACFPIKLRAASKKWKFRAC